MNKIKYEAMDSNRPQRPQLGIGAVSVSFDSLIEQLKEIGYSVFILCAENP